MSKQHVIEIPWEELTMEELCDNERDIVEKAVQAFKLAYAPYSGYRVGSTTLCRDGTDYPGQNVENYSYSATAHAEEISLHNANAAGRGDQVIKLACIGEQEGDRLVAPCAHCLIRMAHYEYRAKEQMVILFGGYGGRTLGRVVGVRTLMPLTFVPEDLHGTEGGSAYDSPPAGRRS